jgi:hypothetical protein
MKTTPTAAVSNRRIRFAKNIIRSSAERHYFRKTTGMKLGFRAWTGQCIDGRRQLKTYHFGAGSRSGNHNCSRRHWTRWFQPDGVSNLTGIRILNNKVLPHPRRQPAETWKLSSTCDVQWHSAYHRSSNRYPPQWIVYQFWEQPNKLMLNVRNLYVEQVGLTVNRITLNGLAGWWSRQNHRYRWPKYKIKPIKKKW